MMTACLPVTLGVLLAATPATPPPLSANVAVIIRRHCSGCHDAESVLDLRELPGAQETKTWTDLLESVRSGQMPPSPKEVAEEWRGPEPKPPPLSPALRQELVTALTAMLEPAPPPEPPRTQVQLSQGEWLYIVREVALPFMTEKELGALIAPRRELAAQAQSHLIAGDVCARIVEVDLGRPANGRRLLRDLPPPQESSPSEAAVESLVRQMFGVVYQQEPTAGEVEEGGSRFRRFLRVAGSTREAAVALCTSYLAGVRVRRLEFTGSLPGR